MAEAPSSTCAEDGLPMVWKISNRRSRKSGCSNIFSGVNLQQLHKLFRTAGDRDAEHRAKLVWQGRDADMEATEERKQMEGEQREEEEEEEEEAGLAQALVGLRVRARNKAGIRAEGHRDNKWLGAPGYLRIKEPLSGYIAEDGGAHLVPSTGEFMLVTENTPVNQNPFKPSSWRLGVARQEGGRDSERYLHRILH